MAEQSHPSLKPSAAPCVPRQPTRVEFEPLPSRPVERAPEIRMRRVTRGMALLALCGVSGAAAFTVSESFVKLWPTAE